MAIRQFDGSGDYVRCSGTFDVSSARKECVVPSHATEFNGNVDPGTGTSLLAG